MQRIVITGASRGLGLEFAKQYLELGDAVVATVRPQSNLESLRDLKRKYPSRLHFVSFDLSAFDEIERFAIKMAGLPVDVLINNAGQIGPETHKGEIGQALFNMDPSVLTRLFVVNAVAPLYLTKSLLPSLLQTAKPRVVALGTTVSIASQTFGDYYGYRMSKSAMNIAFATLAKEIPSDKLKIGIICPGWVRTEMGGPNASLAPSDSVRMMLGLVESFHQEWHGKFLDYSGKLHDF